MNVAPRVQLAALVWLAGCALAAAAPDEPGGYRLGDYQSPVPESLNGQPALSVAQAKALFAEHVLFFDVLPHAPRPEGLAPGTVWVEKPHVSIEGAHWLPEVGRGEISAETEAYYKRELAKFSGGDASRKMVIFCKRACWMSWNAAKRAQAYGYAQVLWFSDGIEGWREADLPTGTVTPEP